MTLADSAFAIPFIFAFRVGGESEDPRELKEIDDAGLAGIRCPHCKWRPKKDSCWTCWDCDYPENFFAGCGTPWNTFETRGVCPTCRYQWVWTSCHACYLWSLHEDWYEDGESTPR